MTHNERVLRLLSDGKPHTHHELYGLHVIAHSRIADLRKRGHVIAAWRDGDDYLYQLCPEEPLGHSLKALTDAVADADDALSVSASSGQLSITDVWRQSLGPTNGEVIPFPGHSVKVA